MLTEPNPSQIQATPTERVVYGAVAGFPLPPVDDAEVEAFITSVRATPDLWRKYRNEPSDFWRVATARWKRTESIRRDPRRLARIELATTAEAVCLTTGVRCPWETVHAVVMLLHSGFSEDRLVEYVQYCHRALIEFDQRDHDQVMARVFSSRVFNHVMPLLRSGRSPDTEGATEMRMIVKRIHELTDDGRG